MQPLEVLPQIAMGVLPGAWLTFAPALKLGSWGRRLGLAVVLSPIAVALETLALRGLGLGFGSAAWVVFAAGLPSSWLIVRAVRSERIDPQPGGLGWAALACAAGIGIVLVWLLRPEFRVFSWHGFLHTDVAYLLTRSGTLFPEEPLLANQRLTYPWLQHLHWAVTGWVSGTAPTGVYLVSNLMLAGIAFLAVFRMAVELGLSRRASVLSAVLAFLGFNIWGVALHAAGIARTPGFGLLAGDTRYTPPLRKFCTFNPMPLALACLTMLFETAVAASRRKLPGLVPAAALLLFALSLGYPLLAPAGWLIVAVFWVVSSRSGRYPRRAYLGLAAAVAASAILVLGYSGWLAAGRSGGYVALSWWGAMVRKAAWIGMALAPLLGAALWGRRRLARLDQPAILVLPGMIAAALYILVSFPGGYEYKFVPCAAIAAAPLAAAALDRKLDGRFGALLALGMTAALSALAAAKFFREMPPFLRAAPPVVANGFRLELAAGHPDAGWTRAVRDRSPEDAVLLSTRSGLTLVTFTGRPLFAPPSDRAGSLPGYGLRLGRYLLEERGYPAAEIGRRTRLTEALFQASGSEQAAAALREILRLGRPVAVHLVGGSQVVSGVLAQYGAERIFKDERNTVWAVRPPG